MDPGLVAIAESISKLGPVAILVLGGLLMVVGILRPGKLVDAERDRIIAERDRREAELAKERDEWRDRSLATDERLDRVAGAFERISKTAAPE